MDVINRWTRAVVYHSETAQTIAAAVLECQQRASEAGEGANLRDADLRGANLRGADLQRAELRGANLRDANLRGANLRGADLQRAELRGANLRGADLRRADLRGADLRGADLVIVRDDIWAVLSSSPAEAAGLLSALREGRVNGSSYVGECACLVGTLANCAAQAYGAMPQLKPDASRPAERFFLGINKGDTPENSQSCKLAAEWVEQWLDSMRAAFGHKTK